MMSVTARPLAKCGPTLDDFIDKAEYLVAHNAPFDRGVLLACCKAAKIVPPRHQFLCTVQMARSKWNLPSAKLPIVCNHLRIPLDHHNALSDAEACAKIAIKALRIIARHSAWLGAISPVLSRSWAESIQPARGGRTAEMLSGFTSATQSPSFSKARPISPAEARAYTASLSSVSLWRGPCK